NLIPVAFGGHHASPLFPGLPLLSQWLPDFKVVNWFGVFGPGGLPADLVQFWNKSLRTAVTHETFQKRMVENGMENLIGPPEELKAAIVADRARWSEVIRATGMRAD